MPKNPLDVRLGARLHTIRQDKDQSAASLARDLGVTDRQIRSFETGENRIGAATLFRIARLLDVPLGVFFDDEPVADPRSPCCLLPSDEFEADMRCVLDRVQDEDVRRSLEGWMSLTR